MNTTSILELQQKVHDFGERRNWAQFHSPKNIAMALTVEASELMEIFQWLTEEQSDALPTDKHKEAGFELADIFMYTLMMAKRMGVDLAQVTQEKLEINERRFPVSNNNNT